MEATLHLFIIILCITVESVLNGIDITLIYYYFMCYTLTFTSIYLRIKKKETAKENEAEKMVVCWNLSKDHIHSECKVLWLSMVSLNTICRSNN